LFFFFFFVVCHWEIASIWTWIDAKKRQHTSWSVGQEDEKTLAGSHAYDMLVNVTTNNLPLHFSIAFFPCYCTAQKFLTFPSPFQFWLVGTSEVYSGDSFGGGSMSANWELDFGKVFGRLLGERRLRGDYGVCANRDSVDFLFGMLTSKI
jgi:hypothetical protein